MRFRALTWMFSNASLHEKERKLAMQETVTESFRLSPQQRHLCALQPFDQTIPFPYRTHIQVRLDGPLEIPLLRLALEQVIARHEILRTTVALVPGFSVPRQMIASSSLLSFMIHDLSAIAADGREKALHAQVEQHSQQPLKLDTGPVVLVTLLVCSANEHYLLLDLPALNGDGITCQLLLRELSQWYEHGQSIEEHLEEPFQYADLAEWQHELLTSTETTAGRAYWREAEQNAQAEVTLPYAQRPTCEVACESETLGLTLSGAMLERLDILANDWQVSRSSLALLCWALVLARLTEQSAVLIGTGFEGRRYTELAETLGLLATYLPLTYRLSPDASCREGARHVEEQLLETRQWQEYFSWEHWREERGQGQESYTAFGFDYTVLPSPWQAGSLRFQIQIQEQWLERFTIRLTCCAQAEALQVMLCYDQKIYTSVEMRRLLAQWHETLLCLSQAPQSIQADVVSLSAEEWELLRAWNATQADYPSDKTLPQLFTEQVARTPEAIALISQNVQIRYQELENRANQIAWYLRHQGVGPEVCVGICLGRTVDMVVGLLGILKAGGVYVPLDPGYPPERLALLVREAGLHLVITQEPLLERLPTAALSTLCLDRDSERLTLESTNAPDSGVCSDNLAYVLYTSGSAGTPKGVMVPHRGLVNYLNWSIQTYQVAQGSGTLVHSPLTFDLTITGLFPPLLTGRSVTLLPEERAVEQLGNALVASSQLSLLKLTPTHLDLLRQSVPAEALAGRTRVLVIGGEALTSDSLRFWCIHAPDTRLFNEYGPTETVVGCCVYEVPADWSADGIVPIGKPIANTRLYVLDPAMHPVPLGVAGELYIGGDGLSRGYLNRPDLTAERFLPDPFAAQPGQLLYKTGDRVRVLSDGSFLFLGRLDQQVKVRGFRIEPGEIEAALRQHPAVNEAVVVARTDGSAQQRLVAYVVGHPAHTLTITDLHQWLQTSLPDYMLPSVFVPLERLPVTANGKLDRQALPAPDGARLVQGTPYIAPQSLEEEVLAGVWSQVLGLNRIGIDDNYFALGGDSIRSIQVIAQAQERGLSFSVDQVFRFPTIRTLAHALLIEHSPQEEAHLHELYTPFALLSQSEREQMPKEVEDAYPLTMLQGGMLFHNEYSPGSGVYHDIFSYHVKLAINLEALAEAARALVARHAVLRTAFDLSSYEEPLQLVYHTGPEILTVEDVQQESAEQQERLIRDWIVAEQQLGFDWTRLPLLRIHVHLRSPETAQFTLSFHHAIIDGWSDAILLTELFTHYFALLKHEPLALPAPAAHYRDFVALERAALASPACQTYWDETLQGSSFTSIPCWPQEERTTGIRAVPVPISSEISHGLKQLALSTSVPIKNVLLAAHMRVLSLLSAQDDVTTCVVSSGRPEGKDGERVLGLFINSIPFRQRLSGGSWRDLVLETFARERETLPYRRYPMAELMRRHGGLRISETLFYFTHYHILSELQEQKNIEILGWIPYEKSSFPLVANFFVDPFNSSVNLSLTCDAAQFSQEQAQAIASYYAATLTALANSAQERYDLADLLSTQESTRILHEWNATQKNYPFVGGLHAWNEAGTSQALHELGLHQLIEEQVARTPEATALVFGSSRLSYQDLNRRANQLAHVLQQQGVGPEVLVGICMERSLEMVISLLAVLKAGGAYVPLDPESPSGRLAFFLSDAQVALVLTQEHLRDRLPATAAPPYLSFEQIMSMLASASTANLPCRVTASNLAYMIYTSGSTGTPKGAMNTHGAIINRLLWMQEAYPLQSDDRVLQKTPFSFDISVWEFFWPLLSGACLVVAAPGLHRDSAALSQLIQKERITTLHFVPSMLQVFLQEPDLKDCQSLRRVICSGEALSFALQERFFACLSAELYNLYGPTEAAVEVSCWVCDPTSTRQLVPIGRPIANIQLYLLDSALQLVPIGVTGELYIAGAGLGRGYLRRPDRTAEVFVPNPFSTEGSRLYKTGDLARYLPDGAIEFLGRSDQQVKLRGFRIEPGEIEAVLNEHPAVRESVVLLREDQVGNPRLVGYVALDAQQAPMLHRLLRWQREGVIQKQACMVLPNGLPIVQKNYNETLFTYRRLFEARQYLQGGITLPDDACVIDVGAHIGLFSLFIGQECSQARIYTIEPMPALFALLQSNMRLYDLSVRLFPCALAQQAGTEILHYYPHISIMSGRFADVEKDRAILKAFLLNEQEMEEAFVDELLAKQMEYEEVLCPVKTVSQILREEGLTRVDLLKIDAERSELAILEGIEAEDWAKIAQIVIEVQDRQDQLKRLCSLLRAQGYVLTVEGVRSQGGDTSYNLLRAQGYVLSVEEQASLGGASQYLVYARRPASDLPERVAARGQSVLSWTTSEAVEQELQALLFQRLPGYMVPSDLILLDDLPVTANGKLDRQALPVPDQGSQGSKQIYVAPRTPLEERLAQIWQHVLGLERVGVHDHFFDLGGHSLKATQVISRVRKLENVSIPLHSLFEHPTIEGLACVIEQTIEHEDDTEWQILTDIENLSDEEIDRLLEQEENSGHE